MIRVDKWGTSLAVMALFALLVLAVQYPLSVSFPIGGDAPSFIENANILLNFWSHPGEALDILQASWYPLTDIMFSLLYFVPVDWPVRFMWGMALGQIFSGLAIGFLAYKVCPENNSLSKINCAGIAVLIWSLTTVEATRHFEDGTLAQLWSMIFLALFIERVIAGSLWRSLFLFFATILTHPVTGLFAITAVVFASLMVLPATVFLKFKFRIQIYVIGVTGLGLALILGGLIKYKLGSNINFISGAATNSFIDLLVSRLSSLIVLAPIGLLAVLISKKRTYVKSIMGTLYSLAILAAANDLLGISLWTDRLLPLLIFMTAVLGALGLQYLLSIVWLSKSMRGIFVIIIFLSLILNTYKAGQATYAYYEDPSNYARVHPEEIQAMAWMASFLPRNSLIYSTAVNRHSEWIPIFTGMNWVPISDSEGILKSPEITINDSSPGLESRYVIIFRKRETVTEGYLKQKEALIFENDSVSIYKLKML